MSVRMISRVWDYSNHKGNDLLMLLAIADFADDDGNAYPAVATLATKCRMLQRNANKILANLRDSGELEIRQNEGPHGTNRYRLVVCDSPLSKRTDEPSVNRQEPSEPSATPQATFPEQGTKKKTSPISLPTWIKDCEASGVDPIPESDPVFEFAESAGIPFELISLAWSEFKVRHADGSKRQKDWRATFRNSVRGNWYKIWFVGNDGLVQISSQGRTLQAAHREAA